MILFHWRQWPRWVQIGAAVLGAACLAVVIIWLLPSFLTRHPHVDSASDRHKAITDTRTGLIAAVVAAGAAGGLAYTVRTYRLSQQGQFTDRYSKAVEHLGEIEEDKLAVRLGGIYALERLMADSERDQPTILEVLAAWIRERTASVTPVPEKVATDIQAALAVIGRRTPVANERSIDFRRAALDGADLTEAHLDLADLSGAHLKKATLSGAHLKNAKLAGANLEAAFLAGANLEAAFLAGAHLEGANLTVAHLEGAYLAMAHLEGADLKGAHLEGADLTFAHLEGADLAMAHLNNAGLSRAHLEGANLFGANLEGAKLGGAHLQGAVLRGADLSTAGSLSQSQLDGSIVDEDTKLPEGLRRPPDPPDLFLSHPVE